MRALLQMLKGKECNSQVLIIRCDRESYKPSRKKPKKKKNQQLQITTGTIRKVT